MIGLVKTVACGACLVGVIVGIKSVYALPDFPWYFWVCVGGFVGMFSGLWDTEL